MFQMHVCCPFLTLALLLSGRQMVKYRGGTSLPAFRVLIVLEALEKRCYCTRELLKYKHPLNSLFCVLCCAVPTLPFIDPAFPLLLTSTVFSFFLCMSGGCRWEALKYLFLFVSFIRLLVHSFTHSFIHDSGFFLSIAHNNF